MSENQGLDIGKVVELIMENPQLIAQISSLAKQKESSITSEEMEDAEAKPQEAAEDATAVSQPTYTPSVQKRSNRSQLFCALKPYVSGERAKAIDSMLAIADILDMMRAR